MKQRYVMIGIFLGLCFSLWADTKSQVRLLLGVDPIQEIVARGNPPLLVPGNQKIAHSTYSITTNQTGLAVHAFCDQDMPQGAQLFLVMSPPRGAKSLGKKPLSKNPETFITHIIPVVAQDLEIMYNISSSYQTPSGSGIRRVTFLLTES